jgi:hypothetical protein
MTLDKIVFNVYHQAFAEDNENPPYFEENRAKVFVSGEDYGEMTIESVMVDSEYVAFELDGTVLTVLLNRPLAPGTLTEVEISFTAYVPKINHRTGANDDAVWFGNFFPTVAVFEEKDGIGVWHTNPYTPAGYPFYSETANYTVTVNTPTGYRVVGTSSETTVRDGEWAVTYIRAVNVRDFAFYVTNRSQVETKKTDKGVNVNLYTFSGVRNSASLLNVIIDSLDFYGTILGSYPYPSINIIETGLQVLGAQSYPAVIFIDSDRLASGSAASNTLRKEIGRQFFYNIVGTNEFAEPWLTDGIISYLAMKQQYSTNQARLNNTANLQMQILRETRHKPLASDLGVYADSEVNFGIQQIKARMMMYHLDRLMGEERFYEFLRLLYTRNLYSITDKADFIKTAEEVYGQPLTDFFDGWLYGTELSS